MNLPTRAAGGCPDDLIHPQILHYMHGRTLRSIADTGIPELNIGAGELLFSISQCGRVFSANYNQFSEGAFHILALKQARGLIITDKHYAVGVWPHKPSHRLTLDTQLVEPVVLARPLDRFLSWGLADGPQTGTAFEKADGTLGILWFNPFTNSWAVATRSSPLADIPNEEGLTYRQAFEECCSAHGLSFSQLTAPLNPLWTYMFEICHRSSENVVEYDESHLQFIAARHLLTGQVCTSDTFQEMPIPGVKKLPQMSWEELLEFVESRPAESAEGVVFQAADRRFKLKSADYLQKHHIKTGKLTERKVFSLVVAGKIDEVYEQLSQRKQVLCDSVMHRVRTSGAHLGNLYAQLEKRLEPILVTCSGDEREMKKQRALVYKEQDSVTAAFLFGIHRHNGAVWEWLKKSGESAAFIDTFMQWEKDHNADS